MENSIYEKFSGGEVDGEINACPECFMGCPGDQKQAVMKMKGKL